MIVEVCAGSVEDCLIAQQAGAQRIELNTALHLGGLTPSLGLVQLALKHVTLPMICMLRPRGGGFHYDALEFQTMLQDAELLLETGIAGLAFGCLEVTGQVAVEQTKQLIDCCHAAGKEAVFHRAVDVVPDMDEAIQTLIQLGCDRILTSGQAGGAPTGVDQLARLQSTYGQQLQLCMGAGITSTNAQSLVQQTGIHQLHGTFKQWHRDPTSVKGAVDYRYSTAGDYEGTSFDEVRAVLAAVNTVQSE